MLGFIFFLNLYKFDFGYVHAFTESYVISFRLYIAQYIASLKSIVISFLQKSLCIMSIRRFSRNSVFVQYLTSRGKWCAKKSEYKNTLSIYAAVFSSKINTTLLQTSD